MKQTSRSNGGKSRRRKKKIQKTKTKKVEEKSDERENANIRLLRAFDNTQTMFEHQRPLTPNC